MVDISTLEKIADKLLADANTTGGLAPSTMRNVAALIRGAIGAPVSWPSRVAGVHAADELYAGSPSMRAAFNHGVKWAVEHYSPTIDPDDTIIPK